MTPSTARCSSLSARATGRNAPADARGARTAKRTRADRLPSRPRWFQPRRQARLANADQRAQDRRHGVGPIAGGGGGRAAGGPSSRHHARMAVCHDCGLLNPRRRESGAAAAGGGTPGMPPKGPDRASPPASAIQPAEPRGRARGVRPSDAGLPADNRDPRGRNTSAGEPVGRAVVDGGPVQPGRCVDDTWRSRSGVKVVPREREGPPAAPGPIAHGTGSYESGQPGLGRRALVPRPARQSPPAGRETSG